MENRETSDGRNSRMKLVGALDEITKKWWDKKRVDHVDQARPFFSFGRNSSWPISDTQQNTHCARLETANEKDNIALVCL